MKTLTPQEEKRLSLNIIERLFDDFSPELDCENGYNYGKKIGILRFDNKEIDFDYKYAYEGIEKNRFGDGVMINREYVQLTEFELCVTDISDSDNISLSDESKKFISETFFNKVKFYYS